MAHVKVQEKTRDVKSKLSRALKRSAIAKVLVNVEIE